MPILACGTVAPPLDSSDFPLQSWRVTAEMLLVSPAPHNLITDLFQSLAKGVDYAIRD